MTRRAGAGRAGSPPWPATPPSTAAATPDPSLPPLGEQGAQLPGPEEAVLAGEELEELRRAVAALPAGDRLLVYRKYYYLQSTAQIAAELGLSPRAVEGRLYRLKKRLAKALGGVRNG